MKVQISNLPFENDVYALAQAFAPDEEIEMFNNADSPYTPYADFVFESEDPVRNGGDYHFVNMPKYEELADRDEQKSYIKKRIYTSLSRATGRRLPWGTLTGIRPVRMVADLMAEGKTPAEIKRILRGQYFVSPARADLAIEIAQRERDLLASFPHEEGYSLYIHIPFCPTRCAYCSFASHPIDRYRKKVPDYLEALKKELQSIAAGVKASGERSGSMKRLQTIYIGGGTPTALEADELKRLMDMIRGIFPMEDVREITVEAGRPDSITKEKLDVLKECGVDRISINPQTMVDATLETIGRAHTAQQIREAYALATEAGFDNINMDIILGLPGEGEEEVRHTLEEISRMRPASLTVHALAIKRAARIHTEEDRYREALKSRRQEIADPKVSIALMDSVAEKAEEMGMAPYYLYRQKAIAGNMENIGYSNDRPCLYNILMMEERHSVIGAGAGAASKLLRREDDQITRIGNPKDVGQYLERIDQICEKKESIEV